MADVIVGLDTEGKVEAACVDAWNPADTPDIMAWIRRGLTVKLVKGPVALGRRLPTPAPESPTVGRRISRAEALQIAKDIGIKAEQERQAQDDPKPPLVGVKPDFPKADNEYAIWRAIGSLAQRVRDLEQPTPAPEPPKPWPIEYSAIGAAIDKLDKEGHLEKPEAKPGWEQAFKDTKSVMKAALNSKGYLTTADIDLCLDKLFQRLASLWPRAGQVPSVDRAVDLAEKDLHYAFDRCAEMGDKFDHAIITNWTNSLRQRLASVVVPAIPSVTELVNWCKGEFPDDEGQVNQMKIVATSLRAWLLSRMGQPAKGDQPVTAEKLAEWTLDHPISQYYDRLEYAEAILQAFPSLGQGRRLALHDTRVQEAIACFDKASGYKVNVDTIHQFADDLLALQGPMTVSKEQWEKLLNLADHNQTLSPFSVRMWLKAEIGMEVQDD